MIGIYKITSPTGKVYIGQSVNIEQRRKLYLHTTSDKRQPLIQRSILKHGFQNHMFDVIHQLPLDVSKDVLTEYERIYMDAYREAGLTMLNISAPKGSPYGAKRSEDQKRRHSEFMKGRPSPLKGTKASEETRKLIRDKRALQIMPKGYKRSKPPWNKGKVMPSGYSKGRPTSEETKEKLRQANLGKKLSEETIRKRTATLKLNGVKRRWSIEAKQRQSQKYIGKKKSDETILKGRYTRGIKNWFHYGF